MKQTPTFHRDRMVTWWDASYQGRRRTSACDVTRCALAKMTKQERARIARIVGAELCTIFERNLEMFLAAADDEAEALAAAEEF